MAIGQKAKDRIRDTVGVTVHTGIQERGDEEILLTL